MAEAKSNRPKLPGKLANLPYFEYTSSLPKTREEQARTDVIYGVKSMDDLLRELNLRLRPNGEKPTKA